MTAGPFAAETSDNAAPSKVAARPRFSLFRQALYGLGAASTGIKMRALSAFLLIFYNQAVGLSPIAVSLAITIVMVVDAVLDPLVGYVSDHLRTPWGRRHPLMYASAVPLAAGFYLLWTPPEGWGASSLFAYLLVCLLVIRFCDTLFELPSVALAPELIEDYDKRTVIVGMRIFFRTVASLAVTVAGLQFFLRDEVGGVASRAGYPAFALAMSITMAVVILVSAAATHRFIPYLQAPSRKAAAKIASPGQFIRDFVTLLRNRSAAAMMGVSMFVGVASAARGGLELYFGLYFWDLTQSQVSLLAVLSAAGAFAGVLLAPPVSKWLGKRMGTIVCYALGLANGVLPILLRLVGWIPANGTDLLFGILIVEAFLLGALYVMTAVIMNSMLADVVEDVAATSGQRSEGILFSADQFFGKAVSGLGVLISGLVLSLIHFPSEAAEAGVSGSILWSMGALYVPLISAVTLVAIACLMLYDIDRAKHARNVEVARRVTRRD